MSLVLYHFVYPEFTVRLVQSFRPVRQLYPPKYVKKDDGRELLWASGPREGDAGEWF